MTKRTPKTTKPEPTAAETYAARQNDIARLMDVLQMELDKHAEKAGAAPNGWGHVGDLDLVRKNMIETVAFISNKEIDEVTEFLAE